MSFPRHFFCVFVIYIVVIVVVCLWMGKFEILCTGFNGGIAEVWHFFFEKKESEIPFNVNC